jgi:hypothetical protein
MKPPNTQAFSAYVGIDWVDTKHDICHQAPDSDRREFRLRDREISGYSFPQ